MHAVVTALLALVPRLTVTKEATGIPDVFSTKLYRYVLG